jgi:hypothetical protein
MFARVLSLALVLFAIACSRDATRRPLPAAHVEGPAAIAGGFDLARLMRVARHAYRLTEKGFAAHDVTYEVDATIEALSFKPRDHRKNGAAVSIRTAGIFAGDARLDEGNARTVVESDGALVITRGAVDERLRNDERGVEESWTFASRPPPGELVVRLSVTGEHFVSIDDSGAHWFDGATGLGVRIGHATFIDANHKKHDVRAEADGYEVVLRVPASIVAQASFPAVLDPLISSELALDGTPVTGAARNRQEEPAIACGATTCLMAWADYRMDESMLYGARTDKTGVLLDPHGLLFASGGESLIEFPSVAWDGSQYFVTYQTGGTTSTWAPTGAMVRVDASGKVVAAPYALPFAPSYQQSTACASGRCLIAGHDSTSAVRFMRFDGSGTALDTSAKTVTTDVTRSRVAVAQLAGTFMLAWTDSALRLRTARVDASGALLDTTPRIPLTAATPHHNAALAASSSGFLVTWQDDTNRGALISASRLDATGAALDPTGIQVARAGDGFFLHPATAVSDGTNFVVLYTELVNDPGTPLLNVLAKRITSAGKLSDMSPIKVTSTNDGSWGAIAFDGAAYQIAVSRSPGLTNMYATRMTTSGTVSPLQLIGKSANTQLSPLVNYGGGQYLLVWNDRRSDEGYNDDIYAARVDASGIVLDPLGIAIAAQPNVTEKQPAIVYDGANWLVLWTQYSILSSRQRIHGRRIDSTGKIVEPSPVPLTSGTNGEGYAAVAFDGTNHLIAWQDLGSPTAVQAKRFDKNLTALDSLIIPVFTSAAFREPAVAFDGTNYLVVAIDFLLGRQDLVGARVSRAGTMLGSTFVVASAAQEQIVPRIASDGTQSLVVWEDHRSLNSDVYGARVKDGVVLDPGGIPIAVGTPNQYSPSVAWDGSNFLVAWDEISTGSFDVRAAFVSTAGLVRGPYLGVAVGTDSEAFPAVAAASTTRRLVAYVRSDSSPAYGSMRVRGRFVNGLASGAPCTGSTQCTSELCVDGVCCESTCTGQCEACDVPGKLGWCSPVAGAPRGSRAACGGTGTGTECGAACDGAERTKCNYPAVDSKACSTTACTAGLETHASTCDGMGLCKDVAKSCGAYVCGTTVCLTTCASSIDCATGFSCKDSACVPAAGLGEPCATSSACTGGLFCTDSVCCGTAACGAGESCSLGKGKCVKLNGVTCTLPSECGSAQCVDGVCCESSCGGQCQACDLADGKGKCLPVLGAPRGTRAACEATADVCAALQCDGTKDVTKCVAFVNSSTKSCSNARCDGEKFVSEAFCNGAGACSTPSETSCVPFGCELTGCRTTCAGDDQCAKGFACREGVCRAIGTKCSDDGAAVIGADGVSAPCTPYVCRTGVCVARCESGADCSADHICSAEGQCMPRPPRAVVEDGGGCAVASSRGSSAWWFGLIALSLRGRLGRRVRGRNGCR